MGSHHGTLGMVAGLIKGANSVQDWFDDGWRTGNEMLHHLIYLRRIPLVISHETCRG